MAIRTPQNAVYEIKPFLLSCLEAKNPKNATNTIAIPVKIKTWGKNSGSASPT